MKHAITEAVESELEHELTTRPDFSDASDSPEDVAFFTLAVLLKRYNVREAGTFSRAAQLMIEAYPGLVPVLAGIEP